MNMGKFAKLIKKLSSLLDFMRSQAFIAGAFCLLSALFLTQVAISLRRAVRSEGQDRYVFPQQKGFFELPDWLAPGVSGRGSLPGRETAASGNCTYPLEYWRDYPDAWGVENITVGRRSYSKDEVLALLRDDRDDPSLALFKQYFTAALNTIHGAYPGVQTGLLDRAGRWVAAHRPNSLLLGDEPQEIRALAERLLEFNLGTEGPGLCPDLPMALAAQFTPTPAPVIIPALPFPFPTPDQGGALPTPAAPAPPQASTSQDSDLPSGGSSQPPSGTGGGGIGDDEEDEAYIIFPDPPPQGSGQPDNPGDPGSGGPGSGGPGSGGPGPGGPGPGGPGSGGPGPGGPGSGGPGSDGPGSGGPGPGGPGSGGPGSGGPGSGGPGPGGPGPGGPGSGGPGDNDGDRDRDHDHDRHRGGGHGDGDHDHHRHGSGGGHGDNDNDHHDDHDHDRHGKGGGKKGGGKGKP